MLLRPQYCQHRAAMNEKDLTATASLSICKAALEEYSLADDTLAELIKKASIEVRDFMLLSFVCDQDRLCADQISRAFGFEPDETRSAIERLLNAKLIELDGFGDHGQTAQCVRPTTNGRKVTEQIHANG